MENGYIIICVEKIGRGRERGRLERLCGRYEIRDHAEDSCFNRKGN